MISTPLNWLLGLGRSTSTSNVTNTSYQTAANQSSLSNVTQNPSAFVNATPINNQMSLQRNLNQLVDEGQRSSLQHKRELISNIDQLSTLSFLNSSTGVNVQRIQDKFEQIDKTLQTTSFAAKAPENRDETILGQYDGKINTNLTDFLKREREKALLTVLRTVEDQVNLEFFHHRIDQFMFPFSRPTKI